MIESKKEASFSDYFYYDETSPSGLRWKVERRGGGKHNNIVLASPGDVAGTKAHRQNGTPMWWQVRFDNKCYRAHRVILMLTSPVLDGIVDHIDGNPFNNKVENLRVVSNAINSRNRKLDCRNTTGVSGVHFETTNNCSYFVAHYMENCKEYKKRFSVKRLGSEEALRLAIEWRKYHVERLNSLGYGYTERHMHG